MDPIKTIVNFSQFKLERHVQTALDLAWQLSEGQPLNTKHLIIAALLVARRESTQAFSKLGTLLPLKPLPKPTPGGTPASFAAMPLVAPLAKSFSIAEAFWAKKETVWGRDYVTLALLAKDDPSLLELAQQAGRSIDEVRQQWFEFLKLDKHRDIKDWKKWWHATRAPLAGETEQVEVPSTAYLFTWNPNRFKFEEIDKLINEITEKNSAHFSWSTGNRNNISIGDRVFLIRQGPEPRGLVGVGTVAGEVGEGIRQFDEKQSEKSKKFLNVDVKWTALSREPFITLSRLIQETGERSLWASRAGGDHIEPTVAQRLEEIWPTAWARQDLGEDFPELEPRQWVARFNADSETRTDSLKIDRYVNSFARVMASRQLKPPMSVGLFGDWGSGKTFFMERLEKKIDMLAQENAPGQPYLQNICQIRFNAWHYAETNLWASLVSTIFNGLRKHLDGDKEDAEEFKKLVSRLDFTSELLKQAEKKLEDVTKEYQCADKRVKDMEEELKQLQPVELSDEVYQKIIVQSVTEVSNIDKQHIKSLFNSAAQLTGNKHLIEAAERLLPDAYNSIKEAQALLQSTKEISTRAGFWWRMLLSAKPYKSPKFWTALVIVVLIPVVLILVPKFFNQSFDWALLVSTLTQILAVATTTVIGIRERFSKARPIFSGLNSLQKTIEQCIEDAQTQDQKTYQAKHDEAIKQKTQISRQLEEARQELQATAEAKQEAQVAVQESTSEARLGRFIRERASAADYEKHLGLIAMIHRDFVTLSRLMVPPDGTEPDTGLPRVDRIILYIDDLDRCHPPEKVVRVLEAVHMLLFFPLFVVVVGVDSRWVSRALYKHYQDMLADEALSDDKQTDDLQRAPANSQDFLEKIFQVPFWLQRMEDKAVQRVIHGLITTEEVERTEDLGEEDIQPPLEEGESLGEPESPPPDYEETLPAELVDINLAKAKHIADEAKDIDDELADAELAAPAQSLTISEAELNFMDDIAPLMPRTPRSVKRFVNIYRLYKAALAPKALGRFLGTPENPGNFRAVQVLLALMTETPPFAKKIFMELYDKENKDKMTLSELANKLQGEEGEETWHTTLDRLKTFAHGDKDLTLIELRYVYSLVSRYTVHHMVSKKPGESGLD